ncbi:hypothetical protein HAX54_024193 [Datura stramonium]|uniref:Uncharacterized protein n=1 Tax=Datura stramonium TaxID=4076 RepID=A0ABS8UZP5_DATST|nr:hypothetical protein [Datura stramonium]
MDKQNSCGKKSRAGEGAPADLNVRGLYQFEQQPLAHPYKQESHHFYQKNTINLRSNSEQPGVITGDGGATVQDQEILKCVGNSMGNQYQNLEIHEALSNLGLVESNLGVRNLSNWPETNFEESPSDNTLKDSTLASRVTSPKQLPVAGAPVAGKDGNQCGSMENISRNLQNQKIP